MATINITHGTAAPTPPDVTIEDVMCTSTDWRDAAAVRDDELRTIRAFHIAAGLDYPPKEKRRPADAIPPELARPWQPPTIKIKTGRSVGKSTSLAARGILAADAERKRKRRAYYAARDAIVRTVVSQDPELRFFRQQASKDKLAKACAGVPLNRDY